MRKILAWLPLIIAVSLLLVFEPAPNAASQHAHRFSDCRFRLVEVLSTSDNKLTIADLEEHTTGLDLIYPIDLGFTALTTPAKDLKLQPVEFSQLKHRKGVLTYCLGCGYALSMIVWERRE